MEDRPDQEHQPPAPATEPEPAPPDSLGEWLRRAREAKGVDLEQAEIDTRIRQRYLEAMEGNDLSSLPDDVVGRGFVRNYALYLGLSPDEALRRSGWTVPSLPGPGRPDVGSAATPLSPGFRPLEMDLFVRERRRPVLLIVLLVLLAAALVSLGAYYGYPWYSGYLPRWGQQAAAPTHTATTAPAPTQTLAVSVSATEVPTTGSTATVDTPAPPATVTPTRTPTRTPTPTRRVYTGITIELAFRDLSWVQVTLDGVRVFQGELDAGGTLTWTAERQVVLRVGNAGAVVVTINGEELGTLGEEGEVVDRIFEILGDDVLQSTLTPEATGLEATPGTTTPEATRLEVTPSITPPVATSAPTSTPTLPISPTLPVSPTLTP
jgi:cytoskeleton protein RodZ